MDVYGIAERQTGRNIAPNEHRLAQFMLSEESSYPAKLIQRIGPPPRADYPDRRAASSQFTRFAIRRFRSDIRRFGPISLIRGFSQHRHLLPVDETVLLQESFAEREGVRSQYRPVDVPGTSQRHRWRWSVGPYEPESPSVSRGTRD